MTPNPLRATASTSVERRPARRDSTTAIEFLRRNERLAAMLPAAERLLRLREEVLALVPEPLRDCCDIAGFDTDVVVLRISSASAAAKLRQTLPRLRDGLLDRGWKVNAIRMRVQPRIKLIESSTYTPQSGTAMSAAAVAAFARLDDHLPDSPLKTAVARLVERRRP